MGNDKKIGTVILGVIGEDVHIVGARILEYALRDAGFKVVSLGAQVSQEEFLNAAIETNADAILISSFSGHAELLVSGFKEKYTEAGFSNVILYIGGYLILEEKPWEEVSKKYLQMGFNRAYPPGTTPTTVIEDLKRDLAFLRR
jgi:methylaspartate mutase sigma subunit